MRFCSSTDSTVWLEVGRQLSSLGWVRAPTGSQHNLLLADGRKKKAIPWHALNLCGGIPQAVNYCRGAKCVTLKSMMTRTLREYHGDAVSEFLPASFVLYPQRPSEDRALLERMLGLPPTAADTDCSDGVAGASGGAENARNGIGVGGWTARSAERSRPPLRAAQSAASAVGDAVGDADGGIGAAAVKGVRRWIAKPSAGGKGQGIVVSSGGADGGAGLAELLAHVDTFGKDSAAFVVQQYIDRPLLLDGGRKFDIRCWVLLTFPYSIYLYTDGVLRTSSVPYDAARFSAHADLTNHCIQETSDAYGKFEEGNELSFDQFDAFLRQARGVDFGASILPQIKHICVQTLLAAHDRVSQAPSDSFRSFHLFGFDFLVDDALKVWLLEVNGSPAAREAYRTDMARELIHAAIDPLFGAAVDRQASDAGSSGATFELLYEARPSPTQ